MGKPKLEWELLDQLDRGEQLIEISRARVHQGWLVMTVVYEGERVIGATVGAYTDPNYEWDENSHKE